MMQQTAVPLRTAADFVERFEEAWAHPSPEGLAALTHPDVVLVTPGMRTMRGRAQAEGGWREVLATLPDLRGEVLHWSADGGVVYIHLRLRATIARRPFEWTLVDRIHVEDGLARERISYFDPTPLQLEMLKSPGKWPRLLRLMMPAKSGHGPGRGAA
jgi:ketosteroid isomerase-like protein